MIPDWYWSVGIVMLVVHMTLFGIAIASLEKGFEGKYLIGLFVMSILLIVAWIAVVPFIWGYLITEYVKIIQDKNKKKSETVHEPQKQTDTD